MKKIMTVLTALLIATIMAVSPASAGTNGWQNIGAEYINFPYSGTDAWSRNVDYGLLHSTRDGGSIGVQVKDHNYSYRSGVRPVMQIQVYEDDGTYGDDHIATFYYYPISDNTRLFTVNINAFRDGSNNQAEVYAKYTANYSAGPTVQWWD